VDGALPSSIAETRPGATGTGGPYTSKHPVPTIRGYREHRAELKERENQTDNEQEYQEEGEEQGDSKTRRAYESVKAIAKDQDRPKSQRDPYPTANRNATDPKTDETDHAERDDFAGEDSDEGKEKKNQEKSATETVAGSIDPKEECKTMKKAKRSGGGREVTDPVTASPGYRS